MAEATTVYEFNAADNAGNPLSLDKFAGKVLLIVNVASKCGFTKSNYTQLAELSSKYREKGLEILLFPCNQFGSQEPGDSSQICQFINGYSKEFHIFQKVDVNGSDAHPLFKFLKKKLSGFLFDGIKWNFTKFLVDRNGHPFKRFAPNDEPKKLEKDIESLLGQSKNVPN